MTYNNIFIDALNTFFTNSYIMRLPEKNNGQCQFDARLHIK